MKKALRRIAFLACVGVLGTTSFGLAYWYFDNQQEVDNSLASNNIVGDDIEENYNFGKNTSDKEGKTYTIYFFPSASYLHLYDEYLDDQQLATPTGVAKPEEQFGYKTALLSDSSSGVSVTYQLSENTGLYSGTDTDGQPLDYGDVTYDGAYRRYMGEHFSCSVFEADGGTAYGSGTAYTASQNVLPSGDRRTWGMPGSIDQISIFEDDPDRVEHFNGRNQYSADRLGSWGDCYYYGETIKDSWSDDGAPAGLIYGDSTDSSKYADMDNTNTGRYIPIKLTVTNELVSSVMEKVIPYIFTSMGTKLDDSKYAYSYMHNYTFTEWTYVSNPSAATDEDRGYPYSPVDNNEGGGEWQENKVGEAFQPSPRSDYFDMLSDLDKYADSEGVIRLFPLFSNGKKGNSGSTYLDGGGSSERLKITESDSSVEYKYPFFHSDTYNEGVGDFTYTDDSGSVVDAVNLSSSYIRLFNYNNISINSSLSELQFSANNVIDSPKNWLTDEGKLQWKNLYTLDADEIQNKLIKQYGEGLYSFYVFVANYSYQKGPTSSNIDSDTSITQYFDAFYDNIVSQASSGSFASLTGKRLTQIEISPDDLTSMGSYKNSPTVVAFEKIDEPKIISSSSEMSEVSTFISDNYSSGRSFYRNVNPLYVAKQNGSTYDKDGEDLKKDSPYTYLVKNVDLSETSKSYFVISFDDSSISTDVFNTSNDDMAYEYLVSNPSSETGIAEDQVFVRPFDATNGYIEAIKKTDSDGTKQVVFKLKGNEALDVYDILIKYNPANGKYDLYMRRHDKLFFYVFDEQLPTPNVGDFVDHKFGSDLKTSSGATLLFDRKYSEGHYVLPTDVSSTANPGGHSLDECLRYKISGSTNYSYSDSSLTKYRLIDRVTGEIVAKYVDNGDGTYSLDCNFKMDKNHILYLDGNGQ